jgi:hypothetical protein
LQEKVMARGGREQLDWFKLAPWARRRRDLLEWLDRLTPTIAELRHAIEQEVDTADHC